MAYARHSQGTPAVRSAMPLSTPNHRGSALRAYSVRHCELHSELLWEVTTEHAMVTQRECEAGYEGKAKEFSGENKAGAYPLSHGSSQRAGVIV